MERSIHIQKVKVRDGKLDVTYDEILTDEKEGITINKITVEGGHRGDQDLIDSMSRLNIHGAIICEQVKIAGKGKGQTNVSEGGALITIPVKVEPGEMAILDQIQVYAFSMGGDEENPGAVLSMKRKLANGKILIINSPFTEFGKENGYKYRNKLAEDLEVISQEAQLYLEGKKAPDPQLELFEHEQSN